MAYEQRAREDRGNWLIPSLVALAIIGGIAYAVANRDNYGTGDTMRGRFGDTTTESAPGAWERDTATERSTTGSETGTSDLGGTGAADEPYGSPSSAGRQ